MPGFTTMKESKAQKPSQSSTLSGVVSEILKESSVTAGPSKSGIEKLDQLIQKALLASALSQDEAAHLAEKIQLRLLVSLWGSRQGLAEGSLLPSALPLPTKEIECALEVSYDQPGSIATFSEAMVPPVEKVPSAAETSLVVR